MFCLRPHKIFKQAIESLNSQKDITAVIKVLNDFTVYVRLVRPSSYRQWSYLDSERKARRQLIAVDITYKGSAFTIVELEQRKNERLTVESCRLFEKRLLHNQILSDVLFKLAKKAFGGICSIWLTD